MTVGRHADGTRENILWERTSPPAPTLPSLSGAVRTDVAIIGGGVAGLATALHLAEREVDVTLLEAHGVGTGSTGRSGGLIAPDLIRHTPSGAEEALGREAGEALVRLVGDSAQLTFDLIARHGMDCDARQDGFWAPAHRPGIAEAQVARAAEWSERGYPVRFADAGETNAVLGTDRYCGALVFAQGGTLNPLAYARGLARRAAEHGARLHTDSPVERLDRAAGEWLLETPAGVLHANRLVLAANGANATLHPGLRRTTMPLDVIEYASHPMPTGVRLLEGNASFTDKQPYVFTARFDAERRVIAAFPDFAIPRRRVVLEREARTRLRQHFPQLRGTDGPEIEFLWPGRAWLNTDLLPRLYDLGDDALAIQACNGRGLAINTAIGMRLAEALGTGDLGALPVPLQDPRPIPGYPLARFAPALLMLYAHLRSKAGRLLKR